MLNWVGGSSDPCNKNTIVIYNGCEREMRRKNVLRFKREITLRDSSKTLLTALWSRLKQLVNKKCTYSWHLEWMQSLNSDASGNAWHSCLQFIASNLFRATGSSVNDRSILHSLIDRYSNLERCLMLLGRLSNLFPPRTNSFNEDKQPISSGISIRLQFFKYSLSRFSKRVIEDGSWLTATPLTVRRFKDVKFPKLSGNLSSFEQLER